MGRREEGCKKMGQLFDIEGKSSLQITGKWLAVGFCLPRNSRGWVSLTTKVSDHTLNLLPNLFSPKN
jgi:hypothetical protein